MTIFVMLGMVVVAPRAMARFGAKAMIVAGLLVTGNRFGVGCR